MPAKLLCGDFYPLPPVPAKASLLAPATKRKLLADIEYVVDFVQMKRGKKISDECWQAILSPEIESDSSASQQIGGVLISMHKPD